MKLLSISGRLVVVIGTNRYSVPMAYSYENNLVNIWSLDDTDIKFSAPLTEVVDNTNTAFPDIDTLEAFLMPLLGFKSATGGSVASLVIESPESGTQQVIYVESSVGEIFSMLANGSAYFRKPVGFSMGCNAETISSPFFPVSQLILGATANVSTQPFRPGYKDISTITSLSPASHNGTIVYDATNNRWLGANGSNWVQFLTAAI